MGTAITLSLNGIDIDWGKNRYWTSHHWLFPPGSLAQVRYTYAGDAHEMKPGFQTTVDEARFRLCHLGYSEQEARTKFDSAVSRWNRTSDLRLTFPEFMSELSTVDFASLRSADLEPYVWDFREFIIDLLKPWDTDDAFLEDFVKEELDFALTLRALAEPVENRSLLLQWMYQDLIDSGWVSFEDLTDIDRQTFIVNHTMLVGRLQDHVGALTVKAFDEWLVHRGLPRSTHYVRVKPDRSLAHETTTLPTAVRNMIHHPENGHNVLSDADLRESVELLLGVAQRLSNPLPGLL